MCKQTVDHIAPRTDALLDDDVFLEVLAKAGATQESMRFELLDIIGIFFNVSIPVFPTCTVAADAPLYMNI